ncbi:MAG: hypothetical protein HYZ14_09990 [Bacteroidetes bacterium]|nr:hypothetical protein [Bacteroidota bacterium]
MKKWCLVLFCFISLTLNAQIKDSLLIGNWELVKIIDNLTGDEILPVRKKADFSYDLTFCEDSLVKFNLEINKCSNSYVIPAKNQIRFLYYAECTKICCDKEFSELLMYEECTSYYHKNSDILVLVSEDRIYYFSRKEH